MENFEKNASQNVDSLFLSPLPFSLLSLSLALPSPLCARQSTRRCRPLAAPLHARARCAAAAPLLPRCAAPSPPHSSAHAALAAPPAHATLGDDRDWPSAVAAARPARAARPAPRPTCPAPLLLLLAHKSRGELLLARPRATAAAIATPSCPTSP